MHFFLCIGDDIKLNEFTGGIRTRFESRVSSSQMEVILFAGVLVPLALLLLWSLFYRAIFQVHSFHPNRKHRILLAILPLACMLLIVLVLARWSSPGVRSNTVWMAFYTMGGAAWLRLGLFLLPLFGISARDDVLERQNPAAAWAVHGTLLGITFCYAGSSVGKGPGTEVVFFCAALSTAFLFGLWSCLERIFRLADRLAIDRDESTGIRIGAWISSLGLIFGAAVAGDRSSLQSTFWDFIRYARVTILFLLAAILIERAFKSIREQAEPRLRASVAIGLAYLFAAAIYVHARGAR